MANVRASGSASAAVVAQLPQWSEVSVIGEEGPWSRIRFASTAGSGEGYISSGLIQTGTAQDARVAYCDVTGGGRLRLEQVTIQSAREICKALDAIKAKVEREAKEAELAAIKALEAQKAKAEREAKEAERTANAARPQIDIHGTVDPSSRLMNPPRYPPSEARQGVGGTVVLIISIDGQGNVLDVSVEKSSRNHNLDLAATDAARKWRFSPAMAGGQGVPSRVRVPVDFIPEFHPAEG